MANIQVNIEVNDNEFKDEGYKKGQWIIEKEVDDYER